MKVRAAACYFAAALLFTFPLALHPFSLLATTQGPGDSYLNVWILGWDLRAILHHPVSLATGGVFNANIFHPATATLAYSDHLLLQALALSPVYLLTGNLAFCYNLLLIVSLVLSATAMHVYVHELTGREAGAWIAGLAWGFAPYHFSHLIHIQLQALYFLPLTFLFLHRIVAAGRRIDAWRLGLMLALQAWSSAYYGLIGAVAIVVAGLVALAATGATQAGLIARRLGLAAGVAAMLVAPIAFEYWWVQHREGFTRSLHEASIGSATLRSYVEVPPTNLVYARTGVLKTHNVEDEAHKSSEQNLFPGFALIGLGLLGIGLAQPDKRWTVVALTAVAAAGFTLSLGPDGWQSLYGALYDSVVGFDGIRAPARFSILPLFGLAALAGLATDDISRRLGGRGKYVPLVAAGLLAGEYVNAPIQFVPAPAIETPTGAWLRQTSEPGAVAYLPLSLDAAVNTKMMVESLAHGRPIVNGYSGERPSFFPAFVDTMADFPSAESLRLLLDLQVKFIISPQAVSLGDWPLVERARLGDGVVYEIHDSPALSTMMTLPETPPLPVPTEIPFAAGEKLTYSVVWASGPLSLPAGTVVLEAREGTNGARFDLAASGTTAEWVSRFFRADDRFVSRVDDRLLPLVFEQHIKEGRRQITRTATFDRGRRVVRVEQGSTIALPIAPDTLDPVALFFYARTLPLTSGTATTVAMNDSRRNFVVHVKIGQTETVSYQGTPTEAVRVEPEIRAADRALPARLTLWISTSVKKRPILAEISGLAGVGTVRLELASALD